MKGIKILLFCLVFLFCSHVVFSQEDIKDLYKLDKKAQNLYDQVRKDIDNKDWTNANKKLHKLIRQYPDNICFNYSKGLIFYKQAEMNPDSLGLWEKAYDQLKESSEKIAYFENVYNTLKGLKSREPKKLWENEFASLNKKNNNQIMNCKSRIADIRQAQDEEQQRIQREQEEERNRRIQEAESNITRYDFTDPKYNYLMDNITRFSEEVNQLAQYQEIISNDLSEIYDERPTERMDDIDTHKGIYNKFLLENSLNDYLWFDSLKILESKYLFNLESYNDIIYKIEDIMLDINSTNNELTKYNSRKDLLEKKLDNYSIYKRELVESEFKSRLRKIPQSVVVIGIMKGNYLEDDDANNYLDYLVAIKVVEQIKGSKHELNLFDSPDQTILDFIRNTSGKCQTADVYSEVKTRPYRSKDDLWVYKFKRIEVFPFDSTAIDEEITILESEFPDSNFNVYVVNDVLYDDFVGRKYLTTGMKEYIEFQLTFSGDINLKYKEAIRDSEDKYKYQLKNLERNIVTINDEIENISEKITSISNKNKEKLIEHQRLVNTDKVSWDEKVNVSEEKYRNFYNSRVREYIATETYNTSGGGRSIFIPELVKESYKILDEVTKQNVSTTISMHHSVEGRSYQKEEKNLVYRPKLDGFRILSIGHLEKELSDGNFEYIARLNIAYELNWTPIPPVEVDNILEIVIDKNLGVQYRLFSLEKYSVMSLMGNDRYKSIVEDGWKIPTLRELKVFYNTLTEQNRLGNDFIDLLNWPSDGIYLTSDKTRFKGSDVIKAIKLSKSDGAYTSEEGQILTGNSAYILLLKEL